MRHYIIALLAVCLAATAFVHPQPAIPVADNSQQQTMQEMPKKEKAEKKQAFDKADIMMLDSLQKVAKKISKEKAKLEKALQKAEEESRKLREGSTKQLHEKLIRDSTRLTKLKIRVLQDSIDAVEAVKAKYRSQIEQLDRQHKADSIAIDQKKRLLATLKNYQQNYIFDLVKAPEDKWKKKNFSEMTLSELQNVCSQYDDPDYKGNANVQAAGEKMKKLLADFTIYNDGRQCLEKPFNKDRVSLIKTRVDSLRKSVEDTNELSILSTQLGNYGEAVEAFQKIIKTIDQRVLKSFAGKPSDDRSKQLCLSQARSQLGNFTKEQAFIQTIPWLKKQLESYTEALKDYSQDNPTRQTILDLKP